MHCWDTNDLTNFSFQPKRLHFRKAVQLTDVSVGGDQVCAREVNSGVVKCWRGTKVKDKGQLFSFSSPGEDLKFSTITSGRGFTCGILRSKSEVFCWGDSGIADEIQRGFKNLSMVSLVAGESHACGLSRNGALVCKGSNDSGQLNVPFSSAFEFSGGLALGANFTCAIRQRSGLVACWGGTNRFEFDSDVIQDVSFESIVAGLDFVCGLTTRNLSMICWGPGWSNKPHLERGLPLPLGQVLPGPCVESSCIARGVYPNSESLCVGSGNVCNPCQIELPLAVPLPPLKRPPSPDLQPTSPKKDEKKISLASVVVGSAGCFAGICTVGYCFWAGFLHKRINSVQPSSANTSSDSNVDSASMANDGSNLPPLRSFSTRQQSSRTFGRQRSGSSSFSVKADNFTLSELAAATNNFSLENKVGIGSFGTVYKGKLMDGREVAVKREESCPKTNKLREKESAFDSELALLSRVHHKHLVGLVGFCQEKDERLLVYEYMSNGALHDHLHNKKNTEKNSSIVNSWKMRIRIALDAARGIDYLHNYAVPSIIHRDIKSSNILLDVNWTARVSDFGLSLLGSECDQEFISTKAVGTVGYIDPEYYVMNVLTAKTDIYGLGVVLLELLTGKKAVFKNEDGSGPLDVVEFAVSQILAGQLHCVLDKRVGPPELNEAEAVELLATTAIHCVNLEGKERPNITDIVANLERALAICQDCSCTDSFSTTTFSSRY